MSRNLLTLTEARLHLRRDEDDTGPDPDLQGLISGASAAVLRYLKSAADSFLDTGGQVPVDSSGTPVIPDDVRSAALIMVGYLDRARDDNPDNAFDYNVLPKPVQALLYPLRSPTLA